MLLVGLAEVSSFESFETLEDISGSSSLHTLHLHFLAWGFKNPENKQIYSYASSIFKNMEIFYKDTIRCIIIL